MALPKAPHPAIAGWAVSLVRLCEQVRTAKFPSVGVQLVTSSFDLASADNRGASVFLQKISISDPTRSESLQAFSKTLVAYNKTNVYLESSYAVLDRWDGGSKVLKNIFDKLKIADKKPGYFNPISLDEFLK